jgi:hypothetical protein
MKASIDMLTPDRRAVSRLLRTAGYLLLLTLVALTLVAEGSQPLHTHEGDTAGLYNRDCPLTELAAFDGASPLPQSSPSPWIPLATGAPVATPSDRPQPFPVRSSDSRAPPAPLS